MKRPVSTLVWGWLLIGAGLFFLLVNTDVLGSYEETITAIAFALAGLAFLAVFAMQREAWWAAIPGFALLGLGGVIAFATINTVPDEWGGSLFLGSLGLGFLAVRAREKTAWWALIPGGILMTLAFVAGLGTRFADERIAGILFSGIAATFGLIYLFGEPERMRWALIPAGISVLLAAAALTGMISAINYGWPALLILVGLGLLLRPLVIRRPSTASGPPAPQE